MRSDRTSRENSPRRGARKGNERDPPGEETQEPTAPGTRSNPPAQISSRGNDNHGFGVVRRTTSSQVRVRCRGGGGSGVHDACEGRNPALSPSPPSELLSRVSHPKDLDVASIPLRAHDPVAGHVDRAHDFLVQRFLRERGQWGGEGKKVSYRARPLLGWMHGNNAYLD